LIGLSTGRRASLSGIDTGLQIFSVDSAVHDVIPTFAEMAGNAEMAHGAFPLNLPNHPKRLREVY
jgi:hypothetical protein